MRSVQQRQESRPILWWLSQSASCSWYKTARYCILYSVQNETGLQMNLEFSHQEELLFAGLLLTAATNADWPMISPDELWEPYQTVKAIQTTGMASPIDFWSSQCILSIGHMSIEQWWPSLPRQSHQSWWCQKNKYISMLSVCKEPLIPLVTHSLTIIPQVYVTLRSSIPDRYLF